MTSTLIHFCVTGLRRTIAAAAAVVLIPASVALAGEFSFSGQVIEGGLVIAQTTPGSTVLVDGAKVRVSDKGVFLVGFNRDHPPTSSVRIRYPDGSTHEHVFEVKNRTYNIQKIEGVPSRTVNPSEKSLKRIRSENALIGKARRVDDARTDFLESFIWPAKGPVSGVYGSQRVFNGVPKRPHFGVDVAGPIGTPVVAPASGRITLAHPDMFYSGGTVMLDHGHGLSSAFLHMDTVLVKEGQMVKQGDQIGTIGKKGRATGPHLDWRINLFKLRLDAAFLVPPMDTTQ